MGLDLEHPKSNQACERTRNLTCRIKDTQSSGKFIPLVESREVEDHTRVESRLGHAEEPSRRHNSSEIRRCSTDHCHGAEDHHRNWEDKLGTKLLGEHVH